MQVSSNRRVLAPALLAGVLMAAYLLLRPYGDAGTATAAAQAFATDRWVLAHVSGALAIAALAWLCASLAGTGTSAVARLARWGGAGGAVLVLPYYGAEAFALHVIGRRALVDPDVFDLVEAVRDQPVALEMFGVGLVLLACSCLAAALAWSRHRTGAEAVLVWPLAALAALLLPQFYLPPVGRMAYGVALLVAAVAFAVAVSGGLPGRRAPGAVEAEPAAGLQSR